MKAKEPRAHEGHNVALTDRRSRSEEMGKRLRGPEPGLMLIAKFHQVGDKMISQIQCPDL